MGMVHDLVAYAKMALRAHDPHQRCAISNASLLSLERCGDTLSIDRIDSTKGYVRGNMQIIALSLNDAKGTSDRVPASAINRLKAKLRRSGGQFDQSAAK